MPELEIIAEVGQTHEGRVDAAVHAVHEFARAGATAIKFQLLTPDRIASPTAKRYWQTDEGGERDQGALFGRNVIPYDQWQPVVDACHSAGVKFLATPFDVLAAKYLAVDYKCQSVKIASGDITNAQLLAYVGTKFEHVILSTGASTDDEIMNAVEWLNTDDLDHPARITLLACTLQYPTPLKDAQLWRIRQLAAIGSLTARDGQQIDYGYSDHTTSTQIGGWAVAAGATTLEKHVTLGGNPANCPDHEMALSPNRFGGYTLSAAQAAAALGSGTGNRDNEAEARHGARRALCAADNHYPGDTITEDTIIPLRPGPIAELSQFCASDFYHLVGFTLVKPIRRGEQITEAHLNLRRS